MELSHKKVADILAERFWRIHPNELDMLGLDRQQFYAREIEKAMDLAVYMTRHRVLEGRGMPMEWQS